MGRNHSYTTEETTHHVLWNTTAEADYFMTQLVRYNTFNTE